MKDPIRKAEIAVLKTSIKKLYTPYLRLGGIPMNEVEDVLCKKGFEILKEGILVIYDSKPLLEEFKWKFRNDIIQYKGHGGVCVVQIPSATKKNLRFDQRGFERGTISDR